MRRRPGITSLLTVNVDFDVGLFKRAPFEVLPVAAAFDLSLCALLASWLLFAAFQSFGLTRYTACESSRSVHRRLGSPHAGDEALLKRPRRVFEICTVATLGLLGLGSPVRRRGIRLLPRCWGLFNGIVGVGTLPAGVLGYRRLVVSRFGRRTRALSQEDGGRGNVDVLCHHVPGM